MIAYVMTKSFCQYLWDIPGLENGLNDIFVDIQINTS